MSQKAHRLRELFDAALELPAEQRSVWLEEACAGDSELRTEVRALLDAHDATCTWLEAGPARDSQPRPGSCAGPYRLVSELGHGGMGTVYLGERTIGRVTQRVAVKLVRPGLASNAEVIRRFEQEREILASLEHPNIARLLDIGSTDDGVPYLVMDYVEGKTIDVWCDVRHTSVAERLRLFCTACEAIQYAHDHRVIHRDLKPGNMLVTADGTLKLLDFGIARLLRSGNDAQTLATATATGARPMTMEYASPEQIRGDEVGPASDVYSLGVLLFELLTGRRPYLSEGRPMHGIAAAICEEPPVTPSLAAPTDTLRRELAGDLDSILLKALRKEPVWRYPSPSEFSADVRRHLAGARVLAREDTARYRAERFVRRLLNPSEGLFHTQGMLLWSAGVLGIVLLVERHQILTGSKAVANTALDAAVLAAWFAWSIRQGVGMERLGKFSPLDRQSWIVFTSITVVIGTLTVASALRESIAPASLAVFWNAGLAAGLLIVGVQASRLMTAGGVALLVSAVLGASFPDAVYLWLAAGLLLGMVVPGLIFTFQRSRNQLQRSEHLGDQRTQIRRE